MTVSIDYLFLYIKYILWMCQQKFYGIVEIAHFWQSLPMITPAQCRAARGLLDWSQLELARRAQVGIVTVHQVEAGLSQPRRATLEVIRRAFESAGVEFIEENGGGPGVRLRKR
jgi:hypothetical protein